MPPGRGGEQAGARTQARRLGRSLRGRWSELVDHHPARLSRRTWQLGVGFVLIVGVIMGLEGYSDRRRKAEGDEGLRVLHLSPAPESALPLTPFPGAAPDAEVEFRALLMRIPADRQTPPTLVAVHTLSGRLNEPVSGALGAHGEYVVSFTPRAGRHAGQIVLAGFRFAPASAAPALAPGESTPALALDLEVPRRIDPPMEPEAGGPLVLQITARLNRPPGSAP